MARIRHIAIFSDDPRRLAQFYVDVYGMKITAECEGQAWVTDGYLDLALLPRRSEKSPKGIHHSGFTLDQSEKPQIYDKMTKLGLAPYDPRAENPAIVRPFVEDAARDIDGNRFDLSLGMRDMEEEKVVQKARHEEAQTVPAK